MQTNTVRLELAGEVVFSTESEWEAAADALVKKHGGGVPKVERVQRDALPASANIDSPPVTDQGPTASSVGHALVASFGAQASRVDFAAITAGSVARAGLRAVKRAPKAVQAGVVDVVGRERSERDLAAAVAQGFAPKPPVYDRGSRVNETGIANARAARLEWERKPVVIDAARGLEARIKGENRRECIVPTAQLRMNEAGELRIPSSATGIPLTEPALFGLTQRLGCGGGKYLAQCWPALRAHNVNAHASAIYVREDIATSEFVEAGKASEAPEPAQSRLRVRDNKETPSGVECYAMVSPGYADCDIDTVADAIAEAVPPEARGAVTYDGTRARFEILFHTTVQPENFVAGEFFRAGVIIDTDDTGGGSLRGRAVVWQNLCLNLIIVDRAASGLFSVRHWGSREELITCFRKGMHAALASIDHFRKAWTLACSEDVVARAAKATEEKLPSVREAMPWIFNGILEEQLVKVPVRRPAAIEGLMRAWEKDDSSATGTTTASRAAVVNAFTRAAHEEWDLDPWEEDAIEAQAGRLLFGRGDRAPAPLPVLAIEEK